MKEYRMLNFNSSKHARRQESLKGSLEFSDTGAFACMTQVLYSVEVV